MFGSDARQHMVAREHELIARLPEAQVSGRVTGRPYRREIPARDVGPLAVFEEHIGLHRVDQRAQRHRRLLQRHHLCLWRAESAQHRAHPLEQIGRLVVAIGDQRGVGGMQ